MKTFIVSSLFALAAVVPLTASAQFSLPSVGGLTKMVGGGSGGDLSGQQDSLVRSFVAANKEVLTANAKMADALGLKVQLADRGGKGELTISYGTLEQLDDLCRRLMRG